MRTATIRVDVPDLVATAVSDAAVQAGMTEGEWLTRAVQNQLGRQAYDEAAGRLPAPPRPRQAAA